MFDLSTCTQNGIHGQRICVVVKSKHLKYIIYHNIKCKLVVVLVLSICHPPAKKNTKSLHVYQNVIQHLC